MELCELASKEQDPNKLMALVAEITRLLDEKKNRLKNAAPQGGANGRVGESNPPGFPPGDLK